MNGDGVCGTFGVPDGFCQQIVTLKFFQNSHDISRDV